MKKRISAILGIVVLLSTTAANEAYAFRFPFFRKKAKTEAPAPAPKKTPYEKFVSRKGMVREEAFVNLYRDGKKVWLEIPDSLFGSKLLLTSLLEDSSDPHMPIGSDLSTSTLLELSRTDSLVLLKSSKTEISARDSDPAIEEAISASKSQTVRFAFPVKYRNGKKSVVVDATSLFSFSNKEAVRLKGQLYEDSTISGAEFSKEDALLKGIESWEGSVAARWTVPTKLTLGGVFGELAEKPRVLLELKIILSRFDVPRSLKKADSRIGTATRTVGSFSSTGEMKKEKYSLRWNISDSRRISVRLDTLLPPSWAKAAGEAILSWNAAFEQAGLGSPIEVLPASAGTVLEDPAVSSVRFSPSLNGHISASLQTSGSTIGSCHIVIPAGFSATARKQGATTIGDVDRRYLEYDICDEAVCEYLKAYMMNIFGKCLGLSPNPAGSFVFSPQQLSDPAFTRANGIVASVLDDVFFNVFARPGDKERGLVTVVDRIGEYDKYAIAWLYDAPDFRFRDDMLYIPPQRVVMDPRAVAGSAGDLGTDKLAFADAVARHSLDIAATAVPYLDRDDVDPSYKVLFLDYLWLRMYSSCYLLSSMVGGMYVNDVRQGSDAPRFECIPVEEQRAALYKIFDIIDAMEGFGEEIRHLAGANPEVGAYNRMTSTQMINAGQRLPVVAMSCKLAGSRYTPDMYLSDLFDYFFRNIRKGELKSGEYMAVNLFLSMLWSMNPVCSQNVSDVLKGGRQAAFAAASSGDSGSFVSGDGESFVSGDSADSQTSYRSTLLSVPPEYAEDFSALGLKYLKQSVSALKNGKIKAKDPKIRGEIEFLLYLAESSLEGTD